MVKVYNFLKLIIIKLKLKIYLFQMALNTDRTSHRKLQKYSDLIDYNQQHNINQHTGINAGNASRLS